MNERHGFLLALASNPTDKTTMLVYADWLRERGETDEELVFRLAAGNLGSWIPVATLDDILGLTPGSVLRTGLAGKRPKRADIRDQTDVCYARSLLDWVRANRDAIDRAERDIIREQKFKALAAEGDVGALLAVGGAREAVTRLARGQRNTGFGSPSDYTSKRKAIAAAKAVMAEREQRRRDRARAETARTGTPGRFFKMSQERWRRRALAAAWEYHRSEHPLFRSQRATIIYGRGGREEYDYPYKGSYKTWRATWKNAGARLDSEDRPTTVIIENSRGRVVARLPFVLGHVGGTKK
jgi:uncharacterized protein (TIGR02996 family)